MTKKELQKYNRLNKRIVRHLAVTSAETMWVWRMMRTIEMAAKAAQSDAEACK